MNRLDGDHWARQYAAGMALAAPAPPGPRLPRRTSSDYCHTCGCSGGFHWAGCNEEEVNP